MRMIRTAPKHNIHNTTRKRKSNHRLYRGSTERETCAMALHAEVRLVLLTDLLPVFIGDLQACLSC